MFLLAADLWAGEVVVVVVMGVVGEVGLVRRRVGVVGA